MPTRTKPEHLDRVVNRLTGEVGTIIDVHTQEGKKKGRPAGPPRFGVMRDSGPRTLVVWRSEECDWTAREGRTHCHRCGADGHTVAYCYCSHCRVEGHATVDCTAGADR